MLVRIRWILLIDLLGLLNTFIDADVRIPPKITTGPNREVIFRQNAKLDLACSARGKPDVTYVWKKNGGDLNLNLPNIRKGADGNIGIENAQKGDEGFYQCFAKNQYGEAMSDIAHIQMVFLESPSGSPETTKRTATEGEPLSLRVTPIGSIPQAIRGWEIAINLQDPKPSPLHTSSRIQIAENGDLHFAYVESSDKLGGKIYKSTGYNAISDEKKGYSYYTLEVQRALENATRSSPKLAFSSNNQVAIIGKPLSLRCFFSGYPAPVVLWEHPGKLPLTGKYAIDKDNTELRISDVASNDEGNYICRVKNGEGHTEHAINVIVQAEPKFNQLTDAPHDINITEGESLTINCSAEAIPEVKVTWFRNGQQLDTKDLQRYSLSEDGKSLTIRDLCRDCKDPNHATDLSVIQCNGSNVHGYAFASGYVNVLSRTMVTIENVTVDPDERVKFEKMYEFAYRCSVRSDPSTQTELKWYKIQKDGSELRLPHELPNVTMVDGLLTIRFIAEENDKNWGKYVGVYVCEGNNGYSRSFKSVLISLDPPRHVVPFVLTWWMILLMAVAGFLILCLIIILIYCCWRYQRGDTYEVDELEEKTTDRDLKKELLAADFQDYRRENCSSYQASRKCSLASNLSQRLQPYNDMESLNDYNVDDVGKFEEDGSFVGNYRGNAID